MDRKSILILVLCFVLLMLWPALVNKIFPPPKQAGRTNIVAGAALTNVFGLTNLPPSTNGLGGAGAAAALPAITAPSSGAFAWQPPTGPEETVKVESADAIYTFTSHGGGLKTVELKGTVETVPCGRGKRADSGKLATLNRDAPVPALALFAGGGLDDARPFAMRATEGGVTAEKTLTNGLRLVKEFVVQSNYMVAAAVRIENPGTEPVALPAQELVIGAATPMGPYDDGTYVRLEWYDGGRTVSADRSWFSNRGFFSCLGLGGAPRAEYQSPGASNVVWASVQNQFFTIVAIPQQAPHGLVARPVDLPPPSSEERERDSRIQAKPVGYQAALVYAPLVIPPGQALERRLEVFAGPKEYNTLAKLGRNVDLVMGFGGFFGWFAKLLLTSMNGLHSLGLSYGATIIAITVIIKILFWPLTQASTRSMKRMQALQPQMKALQEKYKSDPKKMNQKLMEFMKENKVSPLGGCLPLMLQIPVFFGFFQMLRSAIELRGARFLWACDLSQPDTVALVFGFPINPLPLIMGATQIWQMRLTPPSPGVDPVQQKMMQYMPLIFVFMLYNFSAGLALYWTVQNLLSILQMKLTKTMAPAQSAAPAKPLARPAKGK